MLALHVDCFLPIISQARVPAGGGGAAEGGSGKRGEGRGRCDGRVRGVEGAAEGSSAWLDLVEKVRRHVTLPGAVAAPVPSARSLLSQGLAGSWR